jgi:aquaporin Z
LIALNVAARSTGPAIFVGGWAIAQLWLFWVAPIVGGALGGLVYSAFLGESVPAARRAAAPA